MTLPVPLTVRVGDKHVTRELRSLSFRKEAVGGVRNITFQLARPLASLDPDISALSKVYVYDGRSATTVAQGRLADTGRGADTGGEVWDVVAFGPVQHASDITRPLIYVDRSLSDGWTQVDKPPRSKPTIGAGTKPGDAAAIATPGVLAQFPESTVTASGDRASLEYRRIYEAEQKLARISFDWDAGATDASWVLGVVVGNDGNAAATVVTGGANVAGGTVFIATPGDWPNGRNTCRLEFVYTFVSAATPANMWAWWENLSIRSMLLDKAGADITSGYATSTILASEVVADLLGRCLPEFDGAGATVATTAFAMQQLTYPDGVTPAQVLEDLMKVEPAYRWYTTPELMAGSGYGFRWEPWPTTVRYEATLDDGGNFPLSAQDVYNEVGVKWRDQAGLTRWTTRTLACPLLDDEGLTRRATIDLGGDLGSQTQAEEAGDTFLADHNVPKNSGSLTIARPIRDLIAGGMREPWEIEAGELVRVVGVEGYNDALNASTNDGQTVFRIHAMTYNSEGNSAQLDLDSDPRDVTSALVKLLRERTRR